MEFKKRYYSLDPAETLRKSMSVRDNETDERGSAATLHHAQRKAARAKVDDPCVARATQATGRPRTESHNK